MSATGIAGWAVIKAATSAGIAYATAVTYTTAIPDSVSAAAIVSTPAIVSTATVESAAPVAAIPRAGADKEATYEPAWSVIAVRCASVGIIRIVTVRTDRSRIPIAVIPVSSTVPNPDPYTYLGVSR